LGYRAGVIFRVFFDGVIGLAPALCCSQEEMELIFARLRQTLDDLLANPQVRAGAATNGEIAGDLARQSPSSISP